MDTLITLSNKSFQGRQWCWIDSLHLKNTQNSNPEHFRQSEWVGERSDAIKMAIFGFFRTKVFNGLIFNPKIINLIKLWVLQPLMGQDRKLSNHSYFSNSPTASPWANGALWIFVYTRVSSIHNLIKPSILGLKIRSIVNYFKALSSPFNLTNMPRIGTSSVF